MDQTKRLVTSPDFVEVEPTVDNLLNGKCKPIFYIETQRCIYQAHDLNTVMQLWGNSRNDGTTVINVGRIG